MPSAWEEFTNFMLRGHVIVYIIGMCVGASYVAVVNSIVQHLIMPLIYHYLMADESSISNRKLILRKANRDENNVVTHEEIAIGYGSIIESLINFFIISSSVYVVLRVIGHLSKRNLLQEDSPDPETRTDRLLQGIYTLLERQDNTKKNQKQQMNE